MLSSRDILGVATSLSGGHSFDWSDWFDGAPMRFSKVRADSVRGIPSTLTHFEALAPPLTMMFFIIILFERMF